MKEKILIKSESYNIKSALILMIILGVVASIIIFYIPIVSHAEYYDDDYNTYLTHKRAGTCGKYYDSKCDSCDTIEKYPSGLEYAFENAITYDTAYFICSIIVLFTITFVGVLIYFWLRSYELTVTDKRIYGKIAWGKRVDLPVDFISAISTIVILKGISVSTSSGRISFLLIKNANKIYEIMNNLLIERQLKNTNTPVISLEQKNDETDLLKKYKELFDNNVITQEEFEAKKKQLLNL